MLDLHSALSARQKSWLVSIKSALSCSRTELFERGESEGFITPLIDLLGADALLRFLDFESEKVRNQTLWVVLVQGLEDDNLSLVRVSVLPLPKQLGGTEHFNQLVP
mmetsp:Transcript_249/g.288  ORF Transcript_249/g.288 Transcript_249/m.288 type:complete len:107 (+) Transcript_249:264-584(+)